MLKWNIFHDDKYRGFIMICHDISWSFMIYHQLIEKGSAHLQNEIGKDFNLAKEWIKDISECNHEISNIVPSQEQLS